MKINEVRQHDAKAQLKHRLKKNPNYKPLYTLINCENCGKETFRDYSSRKYCSVCSLSDKTKDENGLSKFQRSRLRLKKISIPLGSKINCKGCKSKIIKYQSATKYCLDCGVIIRAKHSAKNRELHPEAWLKTKRKHSKTIRAKMTRRKHDAKKQEKNKAIHEVFTVEEWENKLNSVNGVCSGWPVDECGFVGKDNLYVDHIYPKELAFQNFRNTKNRRKYTIDDVQPLCRSCNTRKGKNYPYYLCRIFQMIR
jgi:hypothetical protein